MILDDGQEQLDSFISNCVAIHDDWRHWAPYDEYSAFPLLLSPPTCVSNSQNLFGLTYSEVLQLHGMWPRQVISPEFRVRSPLANLLADPRALTQVMAAAQAPNRMISLFYSDHPSTEALRAQLGALECAMYPASTTYTDPAARAQWHNLLASAGIPVLPGELCSNQKELTSFLSRHHVAVVKHSDQPPYMVRVGATGVAFPVYAEAYVEARCSPNVQLFVLPDGSIRSLGINEQIIAGLCHIGNQTPALLTVTEIAELLSIGHAVVETMRLSGPVVGLDFVVSDVRQPFVVDVNERFNTSTYPQLLMWRLSHSSRQSAYRMVAQRAHTASLSDIYFGADFPRFDFVRGEGALLAAPTRHEDGMLSFFLMSFGTFGATLDRLHDGAANSIASHCASH